MTLLSRKKKKRFMGVTIVHDGTTKNGSPAVVLTIAKAKGKALADIDIDCDYCTY